MSSPERSDALVFFGATGDLAYKQIFPALQAIVCRVAVEKPFGRNLATAQALNATLRKAFPESSIFRIDHYLGKEPVLNLLYFRFANLSLESLLDRELLALEDDSGDMLAYERLLGDAMRGDASLFAREDAVEAQWRIVDPVLDLETSPHLYDPGSWGPPEADRLVSSIQGGWRRPASQSGAAGSKVSQTRRDS